jgi:uncharacterized membrane protein (DUF4010 family)
MPGSEPGLAMAPRRAHNAGMASLLPYRDLFAALAIGLLIGLERGWQQRGARAGGRVAGLRTYGLIGLLGGLAGMLGARQPLVAAVLAAGAVAVLIIDFRRADRLAERNVSATSEIAALVTFALGVLATSGFAVAAMAVAAVAALLLSRRETLHGWLHGLSETDVDAVIRFAIIAGAIWPVLPDRAMGPYGAWNPFDLWLVVVIVCGFSFAGYIAAKRFGATRGTLATAAIAGLYSSTAVTASLAQRLRGEAEQRPVLAAGIAVASAVMFTRVLVLTALLVPFALPRLALIVVPATLVALGFAGLGLRAAQAAPPAAAQDTRNPFALLPALGFALLVAVLALVVRWAEIRFGNAGIATVLAILMVAVYVAFRFEWQFGVSAILATGHDVLMGAGMFSLFQLDFNLTSVAALLLLAGYSINDVPARIQRAAAQ